MNKTIRVLLAGLAASVLLCAQIPTSPPAGTTTPRATAPQSTAPRAARGSGTVSGTVKDDTGGIIPGATVTLATQNGTIQTVQTRGDGTYTFRGVAAGTYTVSATYSGLQQEGAIMVTVAGGQPATGNVVMSVQAQRQEVTVTDTSTNQVSTDPANNASALVLKDEDLDALPDDPDDLEADLQALAGPSAGPGGNQIFIDGFSGGRLPPKESIREIRINSNPFSAEFDKLGYGRIQIFTKPGSDKFHGQAYYNISDGIWNSRNPYLITPGFEDPPFRTQLFGGNVSGPLGKHASFFIDVERRQIDDNGILTATIPAANFLTTNPYQIYYSTPQRRTTVSPRVDWQLGANNTLSFRYSYLDNNHVLTGIGGFDIPNTTIGGISFPSAGYKADSTENTLQVVETAVLSAKVVNETHLQFDHEYTTDVSQSTAPTLNVGQAFVSGGSGYSAPGYPASYTLENYFELQNYTSVTWGAHVTKFGVRTRTTWLDNLALQDFNGQYSFLGLTTANGTQVSSIQQYLTTIQLLNSGLTSAQVTAMGYGPSKYTVNVGSPYISLRQWDYGPFAQDDWKARPNLTLSFGLRWEDQTNIHDYLDFAPRFGFAWSPDSKGTTGRAKTVIRGGWGMFYDRFGITNVETALRYAQGNAFQTYTLDAPATYDAPFDTQIPLSVLSANGTSSSAAQRYQIDSNLKAPRVMQTAFGIDRQLFARTTLSLNFMNSRGTHELRTVDINAPYVSPTSQPPRLAGNSNITGVRPFGNIGDIYNYEADGVFKQTQAILSVNSTVGKWATIFARYSYSNAHSDTDGLNTFPADPYYFAADWGRSALDIAQSLFLGGSITAPWGLRFSPFLVAHSGVPFNVTTGTDLYLQGLAFASARPAVLTDAGPFHYYYGVPALGPGLSNPFLATSGPALNAVDMIERNAGTGPGYLGLNLRVSKTFGFGTTKFSGPSGGARAGGGGGFGGHGGGGFGGGPRGGPPSETTEHRYNLTISLNARNILNHENLSTPVGAITSPYFLESTGITGGFGAEATASNQRRMDIQLRFAF
ncbi:MAG: TonB-dependent receptor [Acidobacteriaceae bacterium]|nr:TonB-dependent receptor [Acidobacteriaceae bacterium]